MVPPPWLNEFASLYEFEANVLVAGVVLFGELHKTLKILIIQRRCTLPLSQDCCREAM